MVIRRPMPGGPGGALVGMRDRWLLRAQRDMAAHPLGHLLLDPGCGASTSRTACSGAAYVRSGLAARGAVAWPRRCVALVARAYDRGELARAEVARLLEDDALVRQVTDLRGRDGDAAGF